MTVEQPNPGWYPDPSGAQQMRWWDGTRWTGATRPTQDDATDRPRSTAREEEPGLPGVSERPAGSSRRVLARLLLAVGIVGIAIVGGILLGMQLGDSGVDRPTAATGADEPSADPEAAPGEQEDALTGPPAVVGSRDIDPLLGSDRQLASISPDGSAVLETSIEEAGQEVCIRSLDATEPEFCDDSIRFETRYASWSDDSRRVVVGEGQRYFTARDGGDLVLFDRDEGRARRVGDTVPLRSSSRPFRAFIRPAVSPSGDRVAALEFDDSPGVRLIVVDLANGEELLAVPVNPMAWSLLWEPSGDAVWVTALDREDSEFERVNLSTSESRSLANSFSLDSDPDFGVDGELIQISDDGKVGLAFFTELYGSRSATVGGLAFAGLIDLETGASGPILPHEGPDEDDANYFKPDGLRLSSDGTSVVVSYFDDAPTYGDDAVEQPLRLMRIGADAVFAGDPRPEMLVDDLASLTAVPVPQVQVLTIGMTLQVLPLPGTDDRILLALDRRSWDGPATQRVEALLELTFDRAY